ncbi:MAG: hypothetical protein M1833_001202 [Piccolia ochrophora]|nr:MAG: hypothetical protein M1833_001202 [Piccolia ochrophora]
MPHATAKINGTTVAEANDFEFVEGNVYVMGPRHPPKLRPASAVNYSVFSKTQTTTYCPWKGAASYYDIDVAGTTVKDGAWYYPQPLEKAQHIKDHVAFSKSKVEVTKD